MINANSSRFMIPYVALGGLPVHHTLLSVMGSDYFTMSQSWAPCDSPGSPHIPLQQLIFLRCIYLNWGVFRFTSFFQVGIFHKQSSGGELTTHARVWNLPLLNGPQQHFMSLERPTLCTQWHFYAEWRPPRRNSLFKDVNWEACNGCSIRASGLKWTRGVCCWFWKAWGMA